MVRLDLLRYCPNTGKVIYPVRRLARQAQPEQRPYRCEFCRWWHTTTQPKGRGERWQWKV